MLREVPVAILHAENRRMRAEIDVLRGELALVQREFAAACADPARFAPPQPVPKTPPPTSTANLEQKRFAALEENLVLLLEDRFKTLEERIAPVRPAPPSTPVAPLGSGPRGDRTPPPSPSLISGRPAEEFPPLPTQRDSLETAAPSPPPSAHPAPPPPAAAAAEGWTTVGRRKRAKNQAPPSSGTTPVTTAAAAQPTRAQRRRERRRGGKGKGDVAQASASQPPPPPPPPARKETVARERRAPRVRPPKSSAVVLTLKSGAGDRGVTYASLLTQAKSNIRLADLGIEGGLRLRMARTGARMLVLPGASSAPKADALAERLRTAREDCVSSRLGPGRLHHGR
ncbi:hypothetical protein K1T71_013766 [Dendrolimus kikuchii]|uniref:Uncharacterized protein n=1 Tax=Dendrolimus kikuchii TaxID=765133 RepID=A0ACC1CHS9_9NEOP|nr:hypothetical protein K1T71_013766 [Dendrolimus kikuchii]